MFNPNMDNIIFILLLVLLSCIYLLPMIIAMSRNHPNRSSIAVLNFFLGWTFLFWVIALALAVSNPRKV